MIEIMISSSALIVAVSLISHLLRGRISPHLKYGMWGLVALRLMGPWIFPLQMLFSEWKNRFSVMNAAEAVHRQVIEGTELELLTDNVAAGHVYLFEPGELTGEPAVNAIRKAAGVDWQLWIMVVWILGSLALFGYMTWVNMRFERELQRKRRPYRGTLPVFVTKRVYVVEGLLSPCYVGIGYGEAIYLPESIAEDKRKARHALAHEMGHAMHSDRLWGILRCGLLCLYWPNPFVWLAAILSRRDCELSCDETAVRLLGEEERYAYGKTLVDLIAARGQEHTLLSVATTMAAGKATVRERIQILVKHPKTTRLMCLVLSVVAAALAACTFSGAVGGAEEASGGTEAFSPGTETPGGKAGESFAGTEAPSGETGKLSTDTEGIPAVGDGDELVLLNESRSGNYYELTMQRRDIATGEALPAKISLRPETDGTEIRVTAYADEAGEKPSNGPDMGFGYSAEASEDHAFKVSFWNVQAAPYYRIELVEGERHVAYQYATKDESPVEISSINGVVQGKNGTRAGIHRIQVYSGAVWILMSGEDGEEAQRFYNENLIGLRLAGEGEGEELHLPTVGSQDGPAINLLYLFEPGTFPDAVIKEVAAGKGNTGGWFVTELNGYRLGEAVRAFSEAYLNGDRDTALRYSAMPNLDVDHNIKKAPGGSTQMVYTSDEQEPGHKASASYRFLAEGETDSYTYLSMEAEEIDGTWKVTFADFEK